MSRAATLAVVEGFYGAPWSHEARRGVLRFAARAGVGAYIWAPKNDPLHRTRWEEPPASERLGQIGVLADEARALGMRWTHGLSPTLRRGALRQGRVETDAPRVARSLLAVQAVGVRSFLIAFDDTWPTLAPRLATREVGRAHGELARRVADALLEQDEGADLLVVPAIYAGRLDELPAGALAYLRGFAERAGGLRAAWTGPRIFSSWIRGADMRALERATGISLWLWSNAIANDWLPLVTGEPLGRAALERLPGAWPEDLAADVLDDSPRLVALNGAREPELTKASLWCFGAWARDPLRHDARAAFAAGVVEAFGDEGASALAPLLEATARHALAAPGRRDLAALDQEVGALAAAEVGAGERSIAVGAVAARLGGLAALPGRIDAALGEHPVALEVSGTARKLATLARAGLAALECIAPEGGLRGGARREALRRAEVSMAEAARIRWDLDTSAFRWLVRLARVSPARPRSPLLR